MRKLFLAAAFIAAFGIAQAQTDQGGFLATGWSSLGFQSEDYGGGSVSSFGLSAKAGYFFMDNLAGGLAIDYFSYDGESASAIGAFLRYYVGGKFFVGAGYTALSDDRGGILPIEAGYPIFITDNIAVEPTLRYDMGMGNSEDYSAFGLGVGFTLYF
jgi:hypothetical protein